MPQGRDVHDVGIDGVDHDPADVVRVGESHALPGAPAGPRLVHPVTP